VPTDPNRFDPINSRNSTKYWAAITFLKGRGKQRAANARGGEQYRLNLFRAESRDSLISPEKPRSIAIPTTFAIYSPTLIRIMRRREGTRSSNSPSLGRANSLQLGTYFSFFSEDSQIPTWLPAWLSVSRKFTEKVAIWAVRFPPLAVQSQDETVEGNDRNNNVDVLRVSFSYGFGTRNVF
jgi:hypothetical protein